MDLNQKLAARRAELAQEEERQRLEAAALRQAQETAQREAVEAAAREAAEANDAAETSSLSKQTTPAKVVDLDGGTALFGEAVERVTKRQIAVLCFMAALSLFMLTQDLTKAVLWSLVALGYLAFILSGHAKDIKKSRDAP